MNEESEYSIEELMISAISREVRDGEITGIGTLSPIPTAACYLAQVSHAPSGPYLITGDPDWPLGGEYLEFFDLAQRGELGLFFLSGAQIDREGNINLCVIGDHSKPRVRLPGGAGSAMLYYMARRIILFTERHERNQFVPHVDFVTSPGYTPEVKNRLGGPTKVFTPLCVFTFNSQSHYLELVSIHPGVDLVQIRDATGFPLSISGQSGQIPYTQVPTSEELRLIRTVVKERLSKVYPLYASRIGALSDTLLASCYR